MNVSTSGGQAELELEAERSLELRWVEKKKATSTMMPDAEGRDALYGAQTPVRVPAPKERTSSCRHQC